MLRDRLNGAMKDAMRAKDMTRVTTIRMILAAFKDRDIAARTEGPDGGVGEAELVNVLQKLVKQRRDSIEAYEKGGRPELAEKERAEIAVIEDYLPQQMSEDEMKSAIAAAVADTGAAGMKDMGKVMAMLRERHGGTMDFGKASPLVKAALS
ncbi:GatB/YqeY domain-containing protein [Zavarzinia compransoris]|uniref:GatB/YqeY domain-containing protein n=1 Tax=Zavarzinia marina TaxID=2911065 RepID=UPI001F2D987E|nr:GatB/YqeY domain-containing protein [Zavarzinia marina]MCF4164838.1 GatB/YqeY domain-containing protein [Zavarzinia marina]